MSKPLITITNISKRYNQAHEYSLHNVSLEIMAGEKFGILGPNGAGKTTLISILCCIQKQTEGTYSYNLENLTHSTQSILGFVPQDFAFYEELTAIQNLEYFAALYNIPRKTITTRCMHVLQTLGLDTVARKKVRTFSGGMKRRLNLAIGIIHQPAILFLDEPTVGVDIQSKNAIITYLNELNAQGTTIIYTSHHLSEAEHFCNTIAIIDYGKIIACDSVEQLKEKHNAANLKEVLLELTGEGYRDNV
ncbi:MAG TPA: ABC transporter ATP-binding protein [Bacteroidales bacterium]|nr:MAG: putative ABC transporter ATP-binding protein YbhF [Bacteroidetes bacterium ADurb.Bin217]HPH15967.1 ABC transporter ATP-binding protein [Bacteroidales bacterium]HPM12416.1 ABC transporter ATP-binding protein [Bacteroidales bacterium]